LCNEHVDLAVRDECDRELDRLDLRYKRLLDSIVTFLELQTSSLTFSSNQILDFYLKSAQLMESHREKQTRLDEASLDALWDYKEDNRLACEEREGIYQEACKVLQRSPDMTDLQKNFEAVLRQLDTILENYRLYHGKACFIADQYPVSLADDFTNHMKSLCSHFQMEPIAPHRILEEQERLHDLNRRLNRKYLDPSPSAEGGELNEDPLASSPPTDAGDPNPAVDGAPLREYPELFYLEEVIAKDQTEEDEEEGFDDVPEPDPAPHRKYGLLVPFRNFILHFLEDAALTAREEEGGSTTTALLKSDEKEDDSSGAPGIVEKANPSFPWLVMKIFPGQEEPPMVTLFDDETLGKMESDEIEAYEETVAKYFLPQDEATIALLESASDSALAPGETEESGHAAPTLKEFYEKTLAIVARVTERRHERTPKYLRENPPKDSKDSPFVCVLDISSDTLAPMLQDLKISLFSHLEQRSSLRIEEAESLTKKRKADLTEELEDLLRTHWPRSGLVETQIKRPREVELLSHEEKTYRFILSIQEKMAALQNRFDDEVSQAEGCCDEFKTEIHQLTGQLSEVQFKTLASLQVLLLLLPSHLTSSR
jgi:hypothetical protein